MGWLNGWKYRKSHTLTSPSKPLVDCPVGLKIHYGSGSDYDEDVYMNGKCRKDFSDIRITDSDGVTILAPKEDDCWITKTNGVLMEIWFKVPFIPAKPKEKVIYVYFGKTTHAEDKTLERTERQTRLRPFGR